LSAIADFWHGSVASTFRRSRRKRGYISWVDAISHITEQAPAAIAALDDKVRFLAVSCRFLSDNELGEAAKVIGRSLYEIFPDIPRRWREIHVRVLAGEELASEEDFFRRPHPMGTMVDEAMANRRRPDRWRNAIC
jgi:hypothetical protein